MNSVATPLLGGALIGLAVTLMLLFNGRVTGISGILYSSLSRPTQEGLWRWLFLAGLLAGGASVQILRPELLINLSDRNMTAIILAGLLVGYGTVMGSGCTSGHGICGLSRLSVRSLAATVTFMLFGFIAAQVFVYLIGAFA
ncbi:MAG: YeeE/YedE family protein [Bdellovibrionaceae bacterium]|nr:YeeE/YedE family protein [Pseudobdellovibrionaceae bacterium]